MNNLATFSDLESYLFDRYDETIGEGIHNTRNLEHNYLGFISEIQQHDETDPYSEEYQNIRSQLDQKTLTEEEMIKVKDAINKYEMNISKFFAALESLPNTPKNDAFVDDKYVKFQFGHKFLHGKIQIIREKNSDSPDAQQDSSYGIRIVSPDTQKLVDLPIEQVEYSKGFSRSDKIINLVTSQFKLRFNANDSDFHGIDAELQSEDGVTIIINQPAR